MTEIESRISIIINNEIDKVLPDNLNYILSLQTIPERKAKKSKFFKVGICTAAFAVVAVSISIYLLKTPVYKNKIITSDYSLCFNEIKEEPQMSMPFIGSGVPIKSESDLKTYFGFDPIKGVCIPDGLKLSTKMNDAYYLRNGELYYTTVIYLAEDNNLHSEYVNIALSKNHPVVFDIGFDKDKISYICNTKVILSHLSKEERAFGLHGDTYSAEFTYNNVGYSISVANGVTEDEFIHILTSIIKQ